MLYDWLFIALGLILTIGFAIYISRENYTKADIGNVIILDEEGIPNVVDINEVNKFMDIRLNAIASALRGDRIPFHLVEVDWRVNPEPNPRGGRCPSGTVAGNFFRRDTCVYAKWGWAQAGYNFNPK
jgi:hypothetical protein